MIRNLLPWNQPSPWELAWAYNGGISGGGQERYTVPLLLYWFQCPSMVSPLEIEYTCRWLSKYIDIHLMVDWLDQWYPHTWLRMVYLLMEVFQVVTLVQFHWICCTGTNRTMLSIDWHNCEFLAKRIPVQLELMSQQLLDVLQVMYRELMIRLSHVNWLVPSTALTRNHSCHKTSGIKFHFSWKTEVVLFLFSYQQSPSISSMSHPICSSINFSGSTSKPVTFFTLSGLAGFCSLIFIALVCTAEHSSMFVSLTSSDCCLHVMSGWTLFAST